VRPWRLPGEEGGEATPPLGVNDGGLFSLDATLERYWSPPTIHKQVLVWLLEDRVLWFVETDRIESSRPRRK
jgi:hypothetical protein